MSHGTHSSDRLYDRIGRRSLLNATVALVGSGLVAGCTENDQSNDPQEFGAHGDDDPAPATDFRFDADDRGVVEIGHDGGDPVDRAALEIRLDGRVVGDGGDFTDDDAVTEGDTAAVFVADGEPDVDSEAPPDASGLDAGRLIRVLWTGSGGNDDTDDGDTDGDADEGDGDDDSESGAILAEHETE